MLVGTYRDTEVDPGHPLAHTMNRLLRRRLLTRLSLRRLPEDGVAAMVGGLADQVAPAELVGVIHAETDGNPFFVEEVYLHLTEAGVLFADDGGFRTDLHIDEFDVPDTVRLVIGERLARLSQATRDILAAAAVVGRTFELPVASLVADVPAEVMTDALDEAERARLVVPGADPAALMFNHELIRQTLLSETTTVRRQLLHARAAQAVEAVHADELDSVAADIVHHLLYAASHAEPAKLVRFLRLAGERAMEATAFDDAVDHFERALALMTDEAGRAELLERLAIARRSVGQWDEALRAMNEALAGYEALGRKDDIGRVCWTMVYQLAWAARFEEAFVVASRGLEALGDSHTADRARLMSVLGWVTGLAGDYDSATALFDTARDIAEGLGDKRALADVLHMETIHDLGYARFAEGVEAGMAAADAFDAEGARWDLCSVLSFVLYQAGAMGKRELANRLTERIEPLAADLGHLGATFMTLSDRVRAEGVLPAAFDVIDELAPQQIEVCERGGLPWLYVGYLYLGFVADWRGDTDEAHRQLRTASELEPPGAFAGQGAGHLAVHLAHAGRDEEVRQIVRERPAFMPVSGKVNSLGAWNAMLLLTEALYVIGRLDEAASMLPLVEEFLDMAGPEWMLFDGRITEMIGGMAAAAAGRWEQADAHYRSVADTAARMGHRIEQAEVLWFHARMLLDRGTGQDRDRARVMLEEAIERYRALAMPRHVERTEEAQAALGRTR
jgi:tetratricopeptide (TPR) repeat protein